MDDIWKQGGITVLKKIKNRLYDNDSTGNGCIFYSVYERCAGSEWEALELGLTSCHHLFLDLTALQWGDYKYVKLIIVLKLTAPKCG